ncbi:MAG TPA: hypothetical protein VLQ93_19970 [Myxococcaceae bacterium]|nr:hypothetical protein [Myxococcaceae bacterium]
MERLLEKLGRGQQLTAEELEALERLAQKLREPVAEALRALQVGRKVGLLGARTLPDGSRMVVGSPAHKAQCWVDYQFRNMPRYQSFRYQMDPEWERLYHSILANRPAGSGFEREVLSLRGLEHNTAMMMPPPGSRLKGFISDAVPGNPTELVWGQPYHFVEAKAWKELSYTGNLKAMIQYVERYGGHIEVWVRSSSHAQGPTRMTSPLMEALDDLREVGRASVKTHPQP